MVKFFRSYTERFKRSIYAECIYCRETVEDNPEHTVFDCKRCSTEKNVCWEKIGMLSPRSIINAMLVCKENWNTIEEFIIKVIDTKKREERIYQDMEGQ